jgi:DNA-binding MarR family transcriptional regulator
MPNDENTVEQDDMESKILQAVYQKGPALQIELAVRTFSFPEDIVQPVADLEQKGMIQRQAMKTGEMIVLTKKGQEAVEDIA